MDSRDHIVTLRRKCDEAIQLRLEAETLLNDLTARLARARKIERRTRPQQGARERRQARRR